MESCHRRSSAGASCKALPHASNFWATESGKDQYKITATPPDLLSSAGRVEFTMPPPPSKKRRTDKNQLAEITFDPSARNEYLTGFHKRKQQRIKNAQELAAKMEREERVKERRQLREQRRDDLEQHLAEFNTELRRQNPELGSTDAGGTHAAEDGEWAGIDDTATEALSAAPVEREDEYVDEDKYTTVTVEAMGDEDKEEEEEKKEGQTMKAGKDAGATNNGKKRIWSKNAPDGKTKPKKKKFRYESKAERQMTRQKQNKSSKAARARREKKT
nr:ribosomal rna-processing protein 17 [Quercus suber]